ncbi:MAG: glycosyltransferase family 2 protein, partial [Marinirhabdus sp.]
KTRFPSVKIIQNAENYGYAGGYNEALKNIPEPLLVLLNNDVEVTENWLGPMARLFKEDAVLVAAQPKILDHKNKGSFEYAGAAGGFIDVLGYPFCRGRIFFHIERDNGQYSDEAPIFWASGACMFVRSAAFKKVNGFDTHFFAHQEEVDLCWRLRAQGGKVMYSGASTVYHLGGATLAMANPKKTFFNFRNTLLLLLKNDGSPWVWCKIFVRLLLDGPTGLWFLLQGKPGHLFAIVKAHIGFYAQLPRFIKKRRQLATKTRYAAVPSIIWCYFVKRQRHYTHLKNGLFK